MSKQNDAAADRIDQLMERASHLLERRKYFDAERHCIEALDLAHRGSDFERMARILLPLQEARRQKRDMAVDAGEVFIVDEAVPKPGDLRPGMYLVQPPRVGLDGRMLREMADRQEVPIVVVTREPATRDGMWPVVSLGPMVVRTRVKPAEARKPAKAAKPGKGKKKKSESTNGDHGVIRPSAEWFLEANEALGDAAIAGAMESTKSTMARLEELYLRLQSHPDHEKLHQALADTCREALRLGLSRPKPAVHHMGDDELDPDEGGERADD